MPPPFPGMDPYLESPTSWAGVHARLIVAIADQLNRHLPTGFRTDIDEYVWLHAEDDEEGPFARRKPDVFVRGSPRRTRPVHNGATLTMAEPTAEVRLLSGRARKRRRVVIVAADGQRVLTAIEVLSPANKAPGEDREAYLLKRSECLASGTNLVEIDLLRGGDRLPMGRPAPAVSDYYILSSPADRRPHTAVWAFAVPDAIPIFPVPVRPRVAPVPLDLRACLDTAYDNGLYGEKLRYDAPADPPLNSRDAEWASSLFAKPPKKKKGG